MTDRKQDCAQNLRNRILAYDLPPGSELDEASLSGLYGLSRTPLREILQVLQGEGFVRIAANRGARVAPLDLPAVQALFQAGPLIYSAIARLAVEHRTPDQIDTLKAAQMDLLDAAEKDDANACALANHRFHGVMAEMTHNPHLKSTQDRMMVDHTRLVREVFDPTSKKVKKQLKKACNQHERFIDAIETRNVERALTLTLSHWDLSREIFEKTLQRDAAVADLALLDA